VDSAIRFRVLRRHAYLDRAGIGDDGYMETPLMVRILPDGNDDAGHLQTQA